MTKLARPLLALLILFASFVPALAVAQTADLGVSVAADPASVNPGDTLTFTITVLNGGPDAASPTTISSQLSGSGVTATNISGTGGTALSCDLSTLDCTVNLNGGQSAVVTIVTQVDSLTAPGGYLALQSTVSSGTFDPNDENDSAYTSVLVDGAPSADVGVSIASPTVLQAGETGTFTVNVTNQGPDEASGVTVNIGVTAPTGSTTTLTSDGGWSCTALPGTCTAPGPMPVGPVSIEFEVDVDNSAVIGDSVTTTATLGSATDDPNTEDNGPWVSTTNIFGPTTTTTLTATPDDSDIGTTITLTATVSGSPNTGTVTFYDGGSSLGSANVSGSTASITTSSLAAGTHSLTASFTDPTWQFQDSTSAVETVTIRKLVTTTSLDVAPSSGTVGDSVTLTATVDTASGSPTGTVTFYDGADVLGAAPVSGGVASLSTNALPVGDRSLTATYDGDATFETSTSSAVIHPVEPVNSGVALTSSANPSVVGDTVTFTATVTGDTGTPTGTVTFREGSTVLGTTALSGGVATYATDALPLGDHSITATYNGDATFDVSVSAALVQAISPIESGTTLTSSANPSILNETVTFTATVDGSGGTPTGTVTFRDGTTVLGTAPLSGGKATYSTDTLTRGNHTITASYAGDATFDASTSAALVQAVSPIGTGTALTSSANPSVIDKPVTFTATVTGNGGTPTGTVTFRDGSTVIGTAALSNGVATYSTSTLALGTHTITAVYGGDADYAASTSGALTQEVTIDTSVVEETFTELTEDFIANRGKLTAQNIGTPSLGDKPNGPSAGFSGTAQSPVLNFAMNTRSLTGAGTAAEALALGEETTPFGFWIDGTLALHQRPGAGGQYALLGMGADYLANDALLAGVALYLDYMTDVTTTGDVAGRGALIGPYVSAELSDGLYFDASLLGGRSWNDAHATLYGSDFTGSFETTRWMLSSSLSGKLELGDYLVRPDVSLFAGSESSDAYTVTGGGTSVVIGAIRVDTLRVSAGAKVSRAFVLDNGLTLTPSLGARLGGGSNGSFALGNVFGSLTGGFALEGEGWKLTGEAQLNGDSTGFKSQSVKLGIGGRF